MNIKETENKKITLSADFTDSENNTIGVMTAGLSNSNGDASSIGITLYNFEKFISDYETNKGAIDTFMSKVFEKIDELNTTNKK